MWLKSQCCGLKLTRVRSAEDYGKIYVPARIMRPRLRNHVLRNSRLINARNSRRFIKMSKTPRVPPISTELKTYYSKFDLIGKFNIKMQTQPNKFDEVVVCSAKGGLFAGENCVFAFVATAAASWP
jgi:hypothetical protein